MPVITVRPLIKPIPLAKSLPITITLPATATILELKQSIASKFPRLSVERQRLSVEGDEKRKPLDDEATLAQVGLGNGGGVRVKDLGPQIGWRTVYVIEYLGPLLIHPLFFYGKSLVYRYAQPYTHSALQKAVFWLVMLHFVKRELETLYVHKFSRSTMPFAYVYRNSAHYWLLSGLLVALVIYSPSYSQEALEARGDPALDQRWIWGWVGLWAFAQASNFKTHLTVANLRRPGTRERGIPRGYGFDWVSFPNYFFEIVGWAAVWGMTRSWAVLIFLIVGGATMTLWATQKHKAYRKEFGDKYPRKRKIIFPYIY